MSEDTPPLADLTPKQQTFCQEYIVDLNGTQAAIRAGYSPHTANEQASRLLANVNIQEFVQSLFNARAERTKITADKVLRELARVGFGDARSILTWGETGVVLKPSDQLSDDDAAMVSEVTQTVSKDGGSMKVKLHDKLSALEKIGKHLKLFSDKLDVTITDASVDETIKALEKRLEELQRNGG